MLATSHVRLRRFSGPWVVRRGPARCITQEAYSNPKTSKRNRAHYEFAQSIRPESDIRILEVLKCLKCVSRRQQASKHRDCAQDSFNSAFVRSAHVMILCWRSCRQTRNCCLVPGNAFTRHLKGESSFTGSEGITEFDLGKEGGCRSWYAHLASAGPH